MMAILRSPHGWLLAAMMLAALAGTWAEGWHLRARILTFRAQGLAQAGRDGESLEALAGARKADPHYPLAAYLHAVGLKDTAQWDKLGTVIGPMMAIHPNQASAGRLAAEASVRAGKFDEGLARLQTALWINPFPPTGPANFWRIAMIASAREGDENWALASAMRAVEFTADDPVMTPDERIALMNDAAAWLQRAGLNRTAAHLQNAARAAGNKS